MFDAIQKNLYQCDIFEEHVGKQMKILSAVFTDSDAKLTVMYENEGKLESGIYPISRVEVEKYERVDLPTEIAGKKLTFTTTKTEIFNALRQTDIDYAE